MSKISAGIVGLGYEGYSLDYVDTITERVVSDLAGTGEFNLQRIPKIQNYDQGQKAIAAFAPAGCDLIIAVVASWLDARGALPFLLANRGLPVMLYSTGGRTEKGLLVSPAGFAGAPGLLEPLRTTGIKFEFLYEPPDSPTKVAEIARFARAAKAVNELKGKKLGSMGFSDMGLYTTNLDLSALRNVFGVQTEFFDMLEVENQVSRLSPGEVEMFVSKFKQDWAVAGRQPKEETLQRVARVTLALRKIIQEKKLSAFSLKCVEGMMAHMACAPCIMGSLLGDECFYVCECDVAGMLGHLVVNALSNKVVSFLESYEAWDDRILFGVCGFLPPSMIEGRKEMKLFRTDPWEGLMNCSCMQTGRVTLARLCMRGGKFVMHVVTGEAVPARKWLEIGFSEPGMHPSVEIVLDCSMQHFVENVPAQHFSIVYGNYAKELQYFCTLLDVEMVYENRKA